MRRRIANLLMRAAGRVDPTSRPLVQVYSDGSAIIRFDGVPLAKITAGDISDRRPS